LPWLPKPLVLMLIGAAIAIIPVTVLGLFDIGNLWNSIVHPLTSIGRVGSTVSENQQPFFLGGGGWYSSFGAFFMIVFAGSAYTFYKLFRKHLGVAAIMTSAYVLFFAALIFGRFSPDPKHQKLVAFFSATYFYWFVGFVIFIFAAYIYIYNKDKDVFSKVFKEDWNLLLVIIWFILAAVVARGAARTIFTFAPPAAIVAGYFVVDFTKNCLEEIRQKADCFSDCFGSCNSAGVEFHKDN